MSGLIKKFIEGKVKYVVESQPRAESIFEYEKDSFNKKLKDMIDRGKDGALNYISDETLSLDQRKSLYLYSLNIPLSVFNGDLDMKNTPEYEKMVIFANEYFKSGSLNKDVLTNKAREFFDFVEVSATVRYHEIHTRKSQN